MPSCLKEGELLIVQVRPPLSGSFRAGTPGCYSVASPGRVHPRTISHSGVEVYEGNCLFGVSVAWKVLCMQLDSQSPIAPNPLLSQARKQPGLRDQQPLLSWEARSGLAKLLELALDAECVPREAGPSQGSALPWEARPTAVRGKKCENASPECATPFSVDDSDGKGFGASDSLPPPSPLPQAESPGAVPLTACQGLSPFPGVAAE